MTEIELTHSSLVMNTAALGLAAVLNQLCVEQIYRKMMIDVHVFRGH